MLIFEYNKGMKARNKQGFIRKRYSKLPLLTKIMRKKAKKTQVSDS